MDGSEPRSWTFQQGLPWWFWMCLVIPAMVLVAMSISPLPSRPWVGPEPEPPEIWRCEPESVWTTECTDQMPAPYRQMPDALSIRFWTLVVLPRMEAEDLEALAAGEPFRDGAEAAWLAAREASPPPAGEATDFMWAWSFYQVFREQIGEPFDYRDTRAVLERLPELMEGVTPERRRRVMEVSEAVEERWQRVAGVEVRAARERLRAPYLANHARWEQRVAEAEGFDAAQATRRAERNLVRLGTAGWVLFTLFLGVWLRRPTEVRITPQHLRIGRDTFEWMDVVQVRAELGRLVVTLRDGSSRETARLVDADLVLRELRTPIHRHLRSEEAAREEQADRQRVTRALAAVREGDDRQP